MIDFQTVLSATLIILLAIILVLRISYVKETESRLDKTSILGLAFCTFSLSATGFNPSFLDVIAIYILWLIVLFLAIIQTTIVTNPNRVRTRKLISPMEYPDETETQSISDNYTPTLTPVTYRSIVISNTGDYKVFNHKAQIVAPSEFKIAISKLSNKAILREMFVPDFVEVVLLILGFIINWTIIGSITGLNALNPAMFAFWGIICIILYTIRWSYTGPVHFFARLKMIEAELMKGKHVVDFKIIGFIWCAVLIIIGVLT